MAVFRSEVEQGAGIPAEDGSLVRAEWCAGRVGGAAGVTAFDEIELVLPDGYRAYARYWAPAHVRGAVLYLHGIQSHCGWYEASAARLRDAGLAVLQVDRRGSGRNEADRGHAESATQLVDDTLCARDLLAGRSGCRDVHAVGVSWGGKLAVAAYVTNPAAFSSLNLVTPGLFPRIGVTAAEKFRIGMAMVTAPRRLFDIPLNDADLFTTYPPRRAQIESDPLMLRQATAGYYLASRRMDRTVQRLAGASAVPLHLMLASDERIIDNERTVRFVRSLNWHDTRITTYGGARHSLEFEADPSAYLADLTTFIVAHPH